MIFVSPPDDATDNLASASFSRSAPTSAMHILMPARRIGDAAQRQDVAIS
jgi:hypothetical protein